MANLRCRSSCEQLIVSVAEAAGKFCALGLACFLFDCSKIICLWPRSSNERAQIKFLSNSNNFQREKLLIIYKETITHMDQ